MDATTPAKSNTPPAKLTVGDKDTTFHVSHGTIGPSVIDIAKQIGRASVGKEC